MINRGNYRRGLFVGSGSAEAFERVLGEAAERFGWRIHAYVIMSNHFHLAVELGEPNLSEGMKWLQGTWIRRYNAFRALAGRPFQGRYKALLVAPGHAFGQVCHYIHLNPVRARICEPGAVTSYRWSSLHRFTARDRPAWLEATTVLAESGDLTDTTRGWKRYVQYLEFLATDDLARRELVAGRMSRGWCIGDTAFKAQMRAAGRERGAEVERFGGLEPDAIREEREEVWENQLRALAQAAAINLTQLPEQKSAAEKTLLAAAMKRSSSVANAWLARRLRMGAAASASQFARRRMLTMAGRREVEGLLKKVAGK